MSFIEKIFGPVILKKVVGKLAKHAVTTLAGLLASKPILENTGVIIDYTQLETWAAVAFGGLAGSLWNFIQHRFKKKPATV